MSAVFYHLSHVSQWEFPFFPSLTNTPLFILSKFLVLKPQLSQQTWAATKSEEQSPVCTRDEFGLVRESGVSASHPWQSLKGLEEDEVAPQLNSQFSSFIHNLLVLFRSSLKHWQILYSLCPSTPPLLPSSCIFLSAVVSSAVSPHSH